MTGSNHAGPSGSGWAAVSTCPHWEDQGYLGREQSPGLNQTRTGGTSRRWKEGKKANTDGPLQTRGGPGDEDEAFIVTAGSHDCG